MNHLKIILFTLVSIAIASPQAEAQYTGRGSSGATTTTGGVEQPPGPTLVHIPMPDSQPELLEPNSPFWRTVNDYCSRVYFDSTSLYEGADPGMIYGVGFLHKDLRFWLPPSLTEDNHCVLWFYKDINPANCPGNILDPRDIVGFGFGWVF